MVCFVLSEVASHWTLTSRILDLCFRVIIRILVISILVLGIVDWLSLTVLASLLCYLFVQLFLLLFIVTTRGEVYIKVL